MSNKGILSLFQDHLGQVQWHGTYLQPGGDPARVLKLNKTDVESHGHHDQMKIKHKCVLMRTSSWCTGVEIDVMLPPQVKCNIIHKFGSNEPYCFFTKYGHRAKHGNRLRWDPFK